jgi:hypothetical protein
VNSKNKFLCVGTVDFSTGVITWQPDSEGKISHKYDDGETPNVVYSGNGHIVDIN